MTANRFEPHPLAGLFPMLADPDLKELADDIRDNGLIDPIVLHEAKVLDGRNRYRACEIAGVEPRFVVWNGEGGTPLHYVLSQNLHRRHLTTAQRAAIAAEVLPMFQAEARRRQATSTGGANPQLVVKRSQAGTTFRKSRDEAAEMMNVSPASVGRARRVREADPEEFERLKEGTTKSVSAAMKNAGLGDTNAGRTRGRNPGPRERMNYSVDTGKGRQIAEANRQRVANAINAIAGYSGVAGEARWDLIREVISDDEARALAGMCDSSIRALRAMKNHLLER